MMSIPMREASNLPVPDLIAGAERRAAYLSLVTSIVLVVLKFAAYFYTRSEAVYSDALESIVNVLASAFALYAVILSHRPADREHPYGHGKVEFLAAGFEGGMIFLAALVIVARAVGALFYPAPVATGAGLWLIGIAMLANGAVGIYIYQRGRHSGSITLQADGKHLFSDAVTSAAVIVALLLVRFTRFDWADPVAAIGVAIYITTLAIGLLRSSAAGLMDEQDIADDSMIRGILASHTSTGHATPKICSFHKLRHRHSGRYHWVDFHIVVRRDMNVDEGHKIASSIEYEIENALGEGNATAHVEPCVTKECSNCGATLSTQRV